MANRTPHAAEDSFWLADQEYDPAIPIDAITEHPDNPNQGDIGAIAESMSEHGFYGAVLVQRSTRYIVAGNHRHRTAKAKGAQTIPGFWLDVDDDTALRILAIDNRSTHLATFDESKLLALLTGLAARPRGLRGTGYDGDDVDDLVRAIAGDGQGGPDPAGTPGARPSLADRFLVPPFDVLNARDGWWRDRKRQWISLGIASELGRADGLAFGSGARPGRFPEWHEGAKVGATSVFDPVLCELAYRWFSPHGGMVIDPFAGGSVRGLVAAMLGRGYAGCDLSAQQIEANAEQRAVFAERGLLAPRPAEDLGADEITPVEEHDLPAGGRVHVKRDDRYTVHGSGGGKVRSCLAIASAQGQPEGLVTAGSRHSPQVNIVAAVAAALGVPCRVHVPAAEAQTPELLAARAAGAEVIEHRPGHNSVIKARARDDAAASGWTLIPFGMEHPLAVEQTARQVASIGAMDPKPQRIVVPVGSGMSLAGVLAGLDALGLDIPVVGIVVGADPVKRLDQYAPGWRGRCELVDAGLPYDAELHDASLGFPLDPVYEAKCVRHLHDGDLLWVVGCRETEIPAALMPTWHHGDATAWTADLAPESADMIFTCPPYFSLEKYSDDPADLSQMDNAGFAKAYRIILDQAAKALRPDRFAVVIVGDARDTKGALRDLRGLTISAMEDAGLTLASSAVLVTPIGSLIYTAGKGFTSHRNLGRTHQSVLVFAKGSRKAAAAACGPVDTYIPEALAQEGEQTEDGE
jgi:hypothetical protein